MRRSKLQVLCVVLRSRLVVDLTSVKDLYWTGHCAAQTLKILEKIPRGFAPSLRLKSRPCLLARAPTALPLCSGAAVRIQMAVRVSVKSLVPDKVTRHAYTQRRIRSQQEHRGHSG